jgi:hypothetical protein
MRSVCEIVNRMGSKIEYPEACLSANGANDLLDVFADCCQECYEDFTVQTTIRKKSSQLLEEIVSENLCPRTIEATQCSKLAAIPVCF